jgi:hypothetical protein
MAIIAHYVTNAGQLGMLLCIVNEFTKSENQLEELLIDFCELEGEHSRANMAEAVWETLVRYGIETRVRRRNPTSM